MQTFDIDTEIGQTMLKHRSSIQKKRKAVFENRFGDQLQSKCS